MAADRSSSTTGMHVVICPWLAFGHLLPCLDLAQRIASRGHRVSFVSTPRNISRLPPVRPVLAHLVDFVALPLPRVEGLPDGSESTNDVPYEKFELHRKAFDGLAVPFSEYLGTACADWVVVDAFHHWAAAAALEHKVPCAMLALCSANRFISVSKAERAESPSDAEQGMPSAAAAAPAFELARNKYIYTKGSSGMSMLDRISLTLSRCSFVAVRTCAEFEPDTVPLLSTARGKPVVFLGLMPPSPDGRRDGTSEDDTIRWLDAQPAKSVVYVALGSEVPLSAEQVHELALGLELAGTRFLWALRKPSGVSDTDLLPDGFEERSRGRGVVATRWVPQMRILAHDAVGAFLTHCGWNSTIEGLMFGHPLIMLPIVTDQGTNARLLEGKKAGVQVPRNDGDGSFDREGVAVVVRAVLVKEESSRVFAANAKKVQEIVADMAVHERYIDGFIQRLTSYKD